jgi:hypothetical protein
MIYEGTKQCAKCAEKKCCYNFLWHFVIPVLLGSFSTAAGFCVHHFTQRRVEQNHGGLVYLHAKADGICARRTGARSAAVQLIYPPSFFRNFVQSYFN